MFGYFMCRKYKWGVALLLKEARYDVKYVKNGVLTQIARRTKNSKTTNNREYDLNDMSDVEDKIVLHLNDLLAKTWKN